MLTMQMKVMRQIVIDRSITGTRTAKRKGLLMEPNRTLPVSRPIKVRGTRRATRIRPRSRANARINRRTTNVKTKTTRKVRTLKIVLAEVVRKRRRVRPRPLRCTTFKSSPRTIRTNRKGNSRHQHSK